MVCMISFAGIFLFVVTVGNMRNYDLFPVVAIRKAARVFSGMNPVLSTDTAGSADFYLKNLQ